LSGNGTEFGDSKPGGYRIECIHLGHLPDAQSILNSRDDALAAAYVNTQLKDPDMFAATVRDAYNQRDIRDDILELIDGRVIEPHSEPHPASERSCGRGWAFRDVTEALRFERDLAQERNLLRILIESLPDYIYVKDTEGRFLLANTAIAKLMGFEQASELVGKTDFDFFPDELASGFRADEQRVLTTGEPLVSKEERSMMPPGI
jgi:PAS domain-containing protein